MKITFLRPSIGGRRSRDAMEPLVFGILAALTPADIEIAFYDELVETIPLDEPADLVALSVDSYTARRAYQIASVYRSRKIPVVMGGYHPTLLPDEALNWADAVVVGDAESAWPRLLGDARRGQLQRIYRHDELPPLTNLTPDRSIFKGKRYVPTKPVQLGRGCPYACDFCSVHAFYGSSIRMRSVADVLHEIKSLHTRRITIVDDNLFADPEFTRELLTALKPLKLTWGCQVGVDVARDPQLLKLMADSGCIAALIGFESVSEASLAQMRKSWAVRGQTLRDAAHAFQHHGIMIYGSFVLGYDHDTPDTFRQTVQFAIDSKMSLANFTALVPMPGTPLLARLRAENRMIFDQWWLDPNYRFGQATFQPARMTAQELTDGCLWARQRFYRYRSIVSRLFNRSANAKTLTRAALHLGANLIFRLELHRKLHRPLAAPLPLSNSGFPEPSQ